MPESGPIGRFASCVIRRPRPRLPGGDRRPGRGFIVRRRRVGGAAAHRRARLRLRRRAGLTAPRIRPDEPRPADMAAAAPRIPQPTGRRREPQPQSPTDPLRRPTQTPRPADVAPQAPRTRPVDRRRDEPLPRTPSTDPTRRRERRQAVGAVAPPDAPERQAPRRAVAVVVLTGPVRRRVWRTGSGSGARRRRRPDRRSRRSRRCGGSRPWTAGRRSGPRSRPAWPGCGRRIRGSRAPVPGHAEQGGHLGQREAEPLGGLDRAEPVDGRGREHAMAAGAPVGRR